MMDDSNLEARLRRFRAPDPPASLRARSIAAARARLTPRDHIVAWSLAAAALLALTVGLQSATRQMIAQEAWSAPDPAVRAAERLATLLGGSISARHVADQIVADERERAVATFGVLTPSAGVTP